MNPIVFDGANIVFAKDQPQYNQLPARLEQDGTVITVWELTPEERIEIFNTGRLHLRISTFNRPLQPICPSVIPFK